MYSFLLDFILFYSVPSSGARRTPEARVVVSFLVMSVLYIYIVCVFESRDPDDGEIAAARRIVDDVSRGVAKFTLHRGERVDAAASAAVGFLGR